MSYRECPMCWEPEGIDTADYERRGVYTFPNSKECLWMDIVECSECHVKFNISFDAEFDDGMWRDRSTISPLLLLQ